MSHIQPPQITSKIPKPLKAKSSNQALNDSQIQSSIPKSGSRAKPITQRSPSGKPLNAFTKKLLAENAAVLPTPPFKRYTKPLAVTKSQPLSKAATTTAQKRNSTLEKPTLEAENRNAQVARVKSSMALAPSPNNPFMAGIRQLGPRRAVSSLTLGSIKTKPSSTTTAKSLIAPFKALTPKPRAKSQVEKGKGREGKKGLYQSKSLLPLVPPSKQTTSSTNVTEDKDTEHETRNDGPIKTNEDKNNELNIKTDSPESCIMKVEGTISSENEVVNSSPSPYTISNLIPGTPALPRLLSQLNIDTSSPLLKETELSLLQEDDLDQSLDQSLDQPVDQSSPHTSESFSPSMNQLESAQLQSQLQLQPRPQPLPQPQPHPQLTPPYNKDDQPQSPHTPWVATQRSGTRERNHDVDRVSPRDISFIDPVDAIKAGLEASRIARNEKAVLRAEICKAQKENQELILLLSLARSALATTTKDRYSARGKLASMEKERDSAREDRDSACSERDSARGERDNALSELQYLRGMLDKQEWENVERGLQGEIENVRFTKGMIKGFQDVLRLGRKAKVEGKENKDTVE